MHIREEESILQFLDLRLTFFPFPNLIFLCESHFAFSELLVSFLYLKVAIFKTL